MSSQAVLELDGFGVAFGDRIVLSEVSFELPPVGLTSLVGPAGSGKSTLLRTLVGLNDSHPALTTWGTARFAGQPLRDRAGEAPGDLRRGIGFMMQHARFFLDSVRENLVSGLPNRAALEQAQQTRRAVALLEENGLGELVPRLEDDVAGLSKSLQRRLAIVRALASEPLLLLADEPIAGLEEPEAADVMALLAAQAKSRAVLVVTHHQRLARAVGGTTVLLAQGRVHEITPSEEFFSRPRSEAGAAFVRTGGCAGASPAARPEELDGSVADQAPVVPAASAVRGRSGGPRGFFWLQPNRLGGLPRPGIVDSLEYDLDGLTRLGVTVLVTLEETLVVDPEALRRRQIASLHFPIFDMGAPELPAAAALCQRVEELTGAGQVVALHCRAGMGRTGTMLAAQLVFRGEPAREAIDRVRRINPRCIQSTEQVEFLSSFEGFLRGVWGAAPASRAVPSQPLNRGGGI